MSVCDPHPQVLSPCSNDAVGSLQALGTRGDVAFSEYGSTPLTAAQAEVDVVFLYEKTSAEYVFEYLYVQTPDAIPDDIRAVVQERLTTGFTVQLSGTPVTANDILFWKVQIPDPLQVCESLTTGPQYAILRPAQSGITALVALQSFITVVFDTVMADNIWGFEQLSFEKTVGIGDVFVFSWIVTAHSTTGFTLQFSGAPPEANYVLRWQVR